MPVPKRKTARSKRRARRAHWKAWVAEWTFCPRCQEPILTHAVCPNCGYYRGKKIIITKEEKEISQELNK